MLPEKYACLLHHEQQKYERWESLYKCEYYSVYENEFSYMNPKPSVDRPAKVPLVPCVGRNSVWYEELVQMDETSDWEFEPPLLSYDFAAKFLAHVHSFTTVGLEAQATAFSFSVEGVIKYLALMPQRNAVSTVEDRLDVETTELDAVQEFSLTDHRPCIEGYIQRCWLHTHPRFKAFMSSVDIYQMFMHARTNPRSFGIVFSPRGYGLKALCVHITKEGFQELDAHFCEAQNKKKAMAQEKKEFDVKQYVLAQIHISHTKFYCQIPFRLSMESCIVVDLRSEREVIQQLTSFIIKGDPDDCWMLHLH